MSAYHSRADMLRADLNIRRVPKADMALVYRASKETLGQSGRKDPGGQSPGVFLFTRTCSHRPRL